jgi:hypothetical protein
MGERENESAYLGPLARRLKQNLSGYKRKLREHQGRALWVRQAYERLQPIDPDTEDVSALSFYNPCCPERPTRRSKREPQSSQSSQEDRWEEEEEDNSTNPFDEQEDLDDLESDGIEASEILYDTIRNAEHPHWTGNRCSKDTRKWAFEIVLTCRIKGLTMVRDVIRIPSRQSLTAKPGDGYARSDITDIDRVLGRVRAWRNGLEG